MYTVWIIDLRSEPNRIKMKLRTDNTDVLREMCEHLAETVHERGWTMVHEVEAAPLGMRFK